MCNSTAYYDVQDEMWDDAFMRYIILLYLSQTCYLLHQCSLFFLHSDICQEFKIFSHDSCGRHLEPSVTDTAVLFGPSGS